jgi:hypothetical protein
MIEFLKGLTVARRVMLALAALLIMTLAFNFINGLLSRNAITKAKIGENQSEAAIQSGSDAVDTIGRQSASERAGERNIKDLQNDLNKTDNIDQSHSVGVGRLCADQGICPKDELPNADTE